MFTKSYTSKFHQIQLELRAGLSQAPCMASAARSAASLSVLTPVPKKMSPKWSVGWEKWHHPAMQHSLYHSYFVDGL